MGFTRILQRYVKRHLEVVEIVIGWQIGLKISAITVEIRHVECALQSSGLDQPLDRTAFRPSLMRPLSMIRVWVPVEDGSGQNLE